MQRQETSLIEGLPGIAAETVTTWADPFILCAVIIATYFDLASFGIPTVYLTVCILAAAIVVMSALEARRALKYAKPQPIGKLLPHAGVAWIGTLVGMGLIVLAWFTLTEYQLPQYASLFQALPILLALTPVLSAGAILFGTHMRGASERGAYQLGLLALGRIREIRWPYMRDELLTWFIRGFFLPINFCTLFTSINTFRGKELALLSGSFAQNEYYLLIMVYALIIAAVTPGYLFGARFLNTETKAVSSSFFAWTVTLACYPPFWDATLHWFTYYGTSPSPAWIQPWVTASQQVPALMVAVGALILFFSLVHLWGEAQFGIRSSNLANRGIITTGAYRFSKHPVYVAKCIVWFLAWMPFLAGANPLDGLRLTALFFSVCGIFGLRALAEEKLLALDHVYVAYALWMDEHGLFKMIGKLIPPMSFRWRLACWQRQRHKGFIVSPMQLTGVGGGDRTHDLALMKRSL